jgi:hypothetical protein
LRESSNVFARPKTTSRVKRTRSNGGGGNCVYCGYANGVLAYVREIAARTEQYWCPIKHARPIPAPHARYRVFLEYGDARAYRQELPKVRRMLRSHRRKHAMPSRGIFRRGRTFSASPRSSEGARRCLAQFVNALLRVVAGHADCSAAVKPRTEGMMTTITDHDLHIRIHAEYREMPGLKLTLAQASRLFNLEPARCAETLDALVNVGVLRTDGERFLHACGGRQYV